MSNELKTLLESELLTEDTKTSITEAMEQVKATAIEEAKAALDVKYAKKFNKDKAELNSTLLGVVTESVNAEMQELRDDIAAAKRTEIRYARQLQEFKEKYATTLSEQLMNTVKTLVESEMAELKEDIGKAKENRLGQRIFEAYRAEFEEFGVTEDYQTLSTRLAETQTQLEEAQAVATAANKSVKINTLLENLNGSAKSVMKTILENVENPEDLEARYEETIDSVMSDEDEEEVVETDEKEEKKKDGDEVVETDGEEEDEDEDKVEEAERIKAKAILENANTDAEREKNIMLRRAGIKRY